MAFLQVANRAVSKLTADISATDTSFTVTTGDGALFPTGNFVVTIDDERILVGSRSGDTFSSLTRGYDGTTAASHTAGTRIELRIIARHIQELQDFCNTKGQANGLAPLNASAKIDDAYLSQPIATTASPTFAGLIVDTNTIYVDNVNHRLGIGTTSPVARLHIDGGYPSFKITGDGAPVAMHLGTDANTPGGTLVYWMEGTEGSGRAFRWMDKAGGSYVKDVFYIHIDSGNVGIGTTAPSQKLEIVGAMRLVPMSAPSSPAEGTVYYDSSAHKLKVYTNSGWQTISSS